MQTLNGSLRAWFANPRAEILSGIVVALALIPEAIGFSVIAGVDPKVGLYASVVIAIVIAFLGGRPAMISAATAATAVLMGGLVRDHGLQYLLAATVLMGVFQLIAGALRLGRLMRFVSQSVMTGFVNALAILIFLAQLPELLGVPPATYGLVGLGLAIIYLFPLVTKAVPAPLVAIAVLTVLVAAFGLDVRTVAHLGALPSTLPSFALPDVPLTWETLRIIAPVSLTLAAVGLLESLLTAQIVDDMTDTPSDKNRECYGQGAANMASAVFGGMGGCAMIGQSVINVTSGARGRLSTLVAGVFLLALLVLLQDLLAIVPVAALTAVMVMVSINTFSWASVAAAAAQPGAVLGGDAGDGRDHGGDGRPRQGRAGRRAALGRVLRRQGLAPQPGELDPVAGWAGAALPGGGAGLLRLRRHLRRGDRRAGGCGPPRHRRRRGAFLGHLGGRRAGQGGAEGAPARQGGRGHRAERGERDHGRALRGASAGGHRRAAALTVPGGPPASGGGSPRGAALPSDDAYRPCCFRQAASNSRLAGSVIG